MLHVHPVLRYMQLPAGLLRPRVFSLFTCRRVLNVLSAQPCNEAARARRAPGVSSTSSRTPRTGLDHHIDSVMARRGEKHLEALEQEDLT
jgi:hypothetical protein